MKVLYNFMVKVILGISFFSFFILPSVAQIRTQEQMEAIAKAVLMPNNDEQKDANTLARIRRMSFAQICSIKEYCNDRLSIYTANDDSVGFVIVPSNVNMPKVLAYSLTDRFCDVHENVLPLLRLYGETTEVQVEKIKTAISKNVSTMEVTPLLGDIKFNQVPPYNNLCPSIDGEKTPTGCLPTAMAQVMCYYKYPANGTGQVDYTTDTRGLNLSLNLDQVNFDWLNIMPSYSDIEANVQSCTMVDDAWFTTVGSLSDYEGYPMYLKIEPGIQNEMGPDIKSGSLAFVVRKTDGTFVVENSLRCDVPSFPQHSGYPFNYLRRPIIPSSFSDGNYTAYLAICLDGENKWHAVRNKNTNSLVSVKLDKSGCTISMGAQTYSCSYGKVEGQAIAELMRAVGIANRANYDIGGTGSSFNNYCQRMTEHFGYDSDMRYVKSKLFPLSRMYSFIDAELQEGRPVSVCGITADGKGGVGGAHQFLIDAVERKDGVPYYHINWGWGGSCDGYFLLYDMTPDSASKSETYSSNYGYEFNAVLMCNPEDGIPHPQHFYTRGLKGILENNDKIMVSVDKLTNSNPSAVSIKATARLINEKDGVVYDLGYFIDYKNIASYSGWSNLSRIYPLPKDIPNGKYRVELFITQIGDEEIPLDVESFEDEPCVVTILRNSTRIGSLQNAKLEQTTYNLAGQRVSADSYNGIVINGTKKYVKK